MDSSSDPTARRLLTSRRLVGLIGLALVLAFLALFVADNFVLIEVRLVNLHIQMRLAWALLIAVLGGGVIGFALGRFRR